MDIAVLLLGSFLAALVSGVAGFGGSLLLLPVATACVGAKLAVVILTIAQLIGNIARMSAGWQEIDWKSVALFSATSLPLAALGAFGFSALPKDLVSRCIGAILIVLVIVKLAVKKEPPKGKGTLLAGGAITGGLSGLCGSGGPIGAVVFLSLGLRPVAYIASEAATAAAMHFLKIIIYGKLADMNARAVLIGLSMGGCMFAGTYAAKRFIKNMEKNRFQKYVSAMLFIVGVCMLAFGV